jgi:hypothetical protein
MKTERKKKLAFANLNASPLNSLQADLCAYHHHQLSKNVSFDTFAAAVSLSAAGQQCSCICW